MNNYLIQYYTQEISDIYNLTNPIIKKYADQYGFTYSVDNTTRISDKKANWEKIAWISYFLTTIPDGSYVVYQDCDSINIGGDLKTALSPGFELGMVALRGGVNGEQQIQWYNSGVIFMINTPDIRSFWVRVLNRPADLNVPTNDEYGINKELKSLNWTIGNSKPICSMGVEWNYWNNNKKLCDSPNIISWHGMKNEDKILAIKSYIATIK